MKAELLFADFNLYVSERKVRVGLGECGQELVLLVVKAVSSGLIGARYGNSVEF